MSEGKVIAAVVGGDAEELADLLAAGGDVNEQDEQGWTPLAWAAGRGDAEAVKVLLAHGADVTLTGRDNRTPLMIAKAASRTEVAEALTEAEIARGVWVDPRETQPYCRAYYLRDLRRFDGWSENHLQGPEEGSTNGADPGEEGPLDDEAIVYVHQDFTVTRSMWHDEDVLFDQVTPEWRDFCEGELEFAVPSDVL
jgi:ankyrin repeat protein